MSGQGRRGDTGPGSGDWLDDSPLETDEEELFGIGGPGDGDAAGSRVGDEEPWPGPPPEEPRSGPPPEEPRAGPPPEEPRSGRVRIIGAREAGTIVSGASAGAPSAGAPDRDRMSLFDVEEAVEGFSAAPPSEADRTTGTDRPGRGEAAGRAGVPELPHWTDPATGDVPRVLLDDADGSGGAWVATTQQAPVWREHSTDWEEPDEALGELPSDEPPPGALDDSAPRQAPSDFEDLEAVSRHRVHRDHARRRAASRPIARDRGQMARSPSDVNPDVQEPAAAEAGRAGEELWAASEEAIPARRVIPRIVTGLTLGVVVLVCFAAGPFASVVLAGLALTVAAAELLSVLRRSGFKPATLLILVATPLALAGAYNKGESAVVLVTALVVVFSFLWSLAGLSRDRPLVDTGVSLLAFGWIGVLGAFCGLILAPSSFPHRHGVAFFAAALVLTVFYDVGALAFGRWLGRRPLAPGVSPGKTWEGLLGATFTTLVVAVVVVGRISPWSVPRAALLALVVSVAAPLGDLVESVIKRDLSLKDMGSFLPGHGGMLDRIDGLLFVMPAAFYLLRLLHAG